MDRNGYNDSIVPFHSENQCWLCDCNGRGKMDRHEIFHGAYREKSKRLGLWVNLCHEDCHMERIHGGGRDEAMLKAEGQRCAMKKYGWSVDDFIREFGRSYL